ncbi:MAG TPA: vWA domain-containing protein, partial [Actinomycetota bacterium]|nr:vWA domain-containing protein [Actinomycetota bacterium]
MTEITHVTLLLDRSGSMNACRDATIEAYNGYVAGLKTPTDGSDDADVRFTFLQFDTQSLDKVHVGLGIDVVPALTHETYQPRGGTPLIDACVKTIRAVEEAVVAGGGKPKVVVVFQTDGEENSSSEHTLEELRALIAARTAEGWQFTFLGAGVDAYAQAAVYGIAAAGAMSYDHTSKGATRAAFTASAMNTRGFAAGARADVLYSAQQRADAGDRFAPADLTTPVAPNAGGAAPAPTYDAGAARLVQAIVGPNL